MVVALSVAARAAALSSMRFGIFFAHQLPRPWDARAELRRFQESLEQVELADRLGIQYCWGQEHHFLEEYAHSSAPEVFLAAFSQRTRRIRLGHGIVLMPPPYNHPARVAERIATLDLVSDGRVEWGTGESSTRVELEGFGVPYVEKRGMWTEAVREAAKMMCTTPYPGHRGAYFSMPARNVVPKPVQQPHPPLWLACSNRETLKHAARCGVGALTFAFMDPDEARFWVDVYYDTLARECAPIGQAVNPNLAMLTQFMCHRDRDVAAERGLAGARFFAHGLSHYYRTGTHVPGRGSLWDDFQRAPPFEHAGTGGIGTPDELRARFAAFEAAGVDQLILLHQAGNYRHEHICESLELFAAEVLPAFTARDGEHQRRKAAALAPALARAAGLRPAIDAGEPPAVECYPELARRQGVEPAAVGQDRATLPATVWRLQVGARGRRST